MAKDTYDKLKIISDIIKDNKVLVLMGFAALSSGLTNLGQLMASEDEAILKVKMVESHKILKKAMVDQITLMANAYIVPKKKKAKTVIKYKTILKETIVKQECKKCDTILLNHVKELH